MLRQRFEVNPPLISTTIQRGRFNNPFLGFIPKLALSPGGKAMRRSSALSFLGMFGILVLAGSLAGCGRGRSEPELSAEQKHIPRAVELIGEYSQPTKKQPTSIEEVKDWRAKEG